MDVLTHATASADVVVPLTIALLVGRYSREECLEQRELKERRQDQKLHGEDLY